MAKPRKSRAQQPWQEHPLVEEVLAEFQAIDDRMQCAVRFHMLMNQGCPLETPVQYERLFLHSPAGKEEKIYDGPRSLEQSHRRRLLHPRF